MKLHHRQVVEDTTPKVYIGKRIYRDRRGDERISSNWYAETCYRGKDRYAALKTQSRSIAIHRAHQFAEELREKGEAAPVRRQIEISELARQYLEMQINRGLKSKTLEKYEYVLATFVAWADKQFGWPASKCCANWRRRIMAEGTSANEVEVPKAFSVHDAATANWLLRKINEARAYARHVEQWAAAELRRAEREEAFLLHRYGHQLEIWARSQIAQRHDGRKSFFLPAGCIGLRTAPTSLSVQDEPTLLAWCKKNLPDAVRVHETILRSTVLDYVRATGEVVDGAEICGGDERFFIREQKNEGIAATDAE